MGQDLKEQYEEAKAAVLAVGQRLIAIEMEYGDRISGYQSIYEPILARVRRDEPVAPEEAKEALRAKVLEELESAGLEELQAEWDVKHKEWLRLLNLLH